MKTTLSILFIIISLISSPVSKANLPTIDHKSWSDYFLVINERKFHFGITSKGEAIFHPLTRRGEFISSNNPIIFQVQVLENKPDGKIVSKKIKVESLKSSQPASLNPKEAISYQGTVTGDAAFEVTVHPVRDGFSVTGKITDPGELTNPLNLAINVGLRPYVKDTTRTDAEEKNFAKRVKRDKFEVSAGFGKDHEFDFISHTNLFLKFPKGAESLYLKSEGYEFIEITVATEGTERLNFPDKDQIIGDGINFRWIVPNTEAATGEKLHFKAK